MGTGGGPEHDGLYSLMVSRAGKSTTFMYFNSEKTTIEVKVPDKNADLKYLQV